MKTTEMVLEAIRGSGITMTVDQAKQLADTGRTELRPEQIGTCNVAGRCDGIKIKDLGNGCGLYYIPPFTVSYCCQFAS